MTLSNFCENKFPRKLFSVKLDSVYAGTSNNQEVSKYMIAFISKCRSFNLKWKPRLMVDYIIEERTKEITIFINQSVFISMHT